MSVHDHRIAAWPPQRNLACRTARSAGKRPARGPGAGGGCERLRRTQVGPQKAGRRVFGLRGQDAWPTALTGPVAAQA